MVKNLPACKNHRFDPWVGKSPAGGHGNPLQYCCLENPLERGALWPPVHKVTKSWTRLKQLSTHTCTHAPTVRWETWVGKSEHQCMCLEEGPGPGHTGEPGCTPQEDTQHRDSLQPSENKNRNTNEKTKNSKPRGMGRIWYPELLNYCIQKSSFQPQKKSQDIQRNRRVWPISRKNKPTQTVPKKDLMVNIFFLLTVLRMFTN